MKIFKYIMVVFLFLVPATEDCYGDTVNMVFELASFQTHQSSSGHLFLGCGTIKGMPQYFFYVKEGTGLVPLYCETKVAKIYLYKGTPKVILHVSDGHINYVRINKYPLQALFSYNKYGELFYQSNNPYIIEFYIPENSFYNVYEPQLK